MPIDYTRTCFVIMPFGTKLVGKQKVNFDRIYDEIFKPAISAVVLPEGGKLKPCAHGQGLLRRRHRPGDVPVPERLAIRAGRYHRAQRQRDVRDRRAPRGAAVGHRHLPAGRRDHPVRHQSHQGLPLQLSPREERGGGARAGPARAQGIARAERASTARCRSRSGRRRRSRSGDEVQALLLEAENALRRSTGPPRSRSCARP